MKHRAEIACTSTCTSPASIRSHHRKVAALPFLLLSTLVVGSLAAPAWSQVAAPPTDRAAGDLLAHPRGRGVPLSDFTHEMAVQARHERALFAIPGVTGVGVTLVDGERALLVLLDEQADADRVPRVLEGVPVQVQVSGDLALLDCSGPGACHAEHVPFPVPMGNATSNALTCNSGTLGFKACHLNSLTIGYVSANHVAAGAPNSRSPNCFNAPTGTLQMHPGNFEDPVCTPSNVTFTNLIGTLHSYVPVNGSRLNAADAAFVASGDDQTAWEIRDIGHPATVSGFPVMHSCVKKSGRTTGLTWGFVEAANVTMVVDEFDRCFTEPLTFSNVIQIRRALPQDNCTPVQVVDFAAKGDSGAAVLDTSHRIIGLAFLEGRHGETYAASIQTVLGRLGLSLDPRDCTTQVELEPVADSFIAQEQPTRTFGSNSVLRIRNTATGTGRYTFLKFQVPEHGGRIAWAKLLMRVESTIHQAALFAVAGMAWNESTLSWANWDDSSPSVTFLSDHFALPAPPGWYSFDVTSAVRAPGEVTIGLASQVDSGQQDFYSRESASPPRLLIAYTGR